MQVCRGCHGKSLARDGQTRLVYHVKHHAHALALLSEETPHAFAVLAEDHRAGGRAVQAHLALYARTDHVVKGAEGAVGTHRILGNDEKRYAPGTLRVALYAGEHEVDDVFVQVALAARDEGLLPAYPKAPVGKPSRLCAECAHVASRARLRQAHAPPPAAREDIFHIEGALFVRSEVAKQRRVAVPQNGIGEKRHARRGEYLVTRERDRFGHSHPPLVVGIGYSQKTRLVIGRKGLLHAGGYAHLFGGRIVVYAESVGLAVGLVQDVVRDARGEAKRLLALRASKVGKGREAA
ncbi:MAG: hypothetical protein BWY96_01623 [Spirochaetes bacterium ADurb.BinA120]|nr:MAG: hypothetical protein BWY96_01623 [Spirochaetes bacterium ADurb.BinA120]